MHLRSIVAFVIALFWTITASAAEISRVIIYLYDWDVDIRSALTVDEVRKQWFTKIDIENPLAIDSFMRKLPGTWIENPETDRRADVRLVIDAIRSDGRVTTYYASSFYLFADEGLRRANIGDDFKNIFRVAR